MDLLILISHKNYPFCENVFINKLRRVNSSDSGIYFAIRVEKLKKLFYILEECETNKVTKVTILFN